MIFSVRDRSRQLPRLGVVVGLIGLLAGCGREEAKTYQVAKECAPTPATNLPPGHPTVPGDMSAMSGTGMTLPGGLPKLTWTKPEGWVEGPRGSIRAASFAVKNDAGKQADVSVIPLPGAAGGDESNVNRWRGQVGLAALSGEELAKTAESVEIAGETAKLYDLAGAAGGSGEASRILGVIQHREGMAWFFKMTGDDPLVAKEKPAFVAFLKSLQFEPGDPAASLPANHPPIDQPALPAGHPEVSSPATAAAPAATSNEGKPQWTVPAGWKEIPGGQFLVAKFTIGTGATPAAVNVSMSAGDGGGLLANVNRWRGQLGQSPWTDAELQKTATEISLADGKATLVEMSGTDARTGQAATVVGAIVPRGGQTWFYKLMGDAASVASQKEAFTQFVKGVQY
jgi:hypothetical protein